MRFLAQNAFGLGVALVLVIAYAHNAYMGPSIEPIHFENETRALAASLPEHIRIPAVGIDADFEAPLGVDEHGEIEVPKAFDTVAWYRYGPTPGEIGPAVVLGHVDSFIGPEVFYPLRDIEEGDHIEIERQDGTTVEFGVTEVRYVSQDDFPTHDVYGDIPYAGLRLITCSGSFDHGTGHYSHNLIVFAKRIER